MNKDLDQFYTKPEIARVLVDRAHAMLNFNKFDNIIEPGAGSGRILELLPKSKRIGLDLEPNHPEVIKMDFFDYQFPKGKNLVVGNPPFGKQGKMSVNFFNKCADNADAIIFIVPRIWNKWRIQKQLNTDFGLYWTCILPDNAFTFGDKDYKVKTCAQLWSKEKPLVYGGYESLHPKITKKDLLDIDNYLTKNNIYEES